MVLRQHGVGFREARKVLILVYFISIILISLEFLKLNSTDYGLMDLYTLGNFALAAIDAFCLTIVAAAIYLRTPDKGISRMLYDIFKRRNHATIIICYGLYIVATATYLFLFHPYTIDTVKDLWGIARASPEFNFTFALSLIPLLMFLLVYTVPLLIKASRQQQSKEMKSSLILLAASWAAVSTIFVVFDAFNFELSIDTHGLMYFSFSIIFAFSAIAFNRSSTLLEFVSSKPNVEAKAVSKQFTKRVGESLEFLRGKSFLLDVEPSVPYERVVREFCDEFSSNNHVVFVFTYANSTIHKILSGNSSLRFFIGTNSVSYPKQANKTNEVLIPQDDSAIYLDLFSKTIESSKGGGIVFVFDSISDMLVSSGFEPTYKFLKSANEVLAVTNVTSLFLMTEGIHDPKVVATVKSLFPNHMISSMDYEAKITRRSD